MFKYNVTVSFKDDYSEGFIFANKTITLEDKLENEYYLEKAMSLISEKILEEGFNRCTHNSVYGMSIINIIELKG